MKILILGINYDPEPTGIAVYTSGLARGLRDRGHEIHVVTGQPYYPQWKINKDFRTLAYRKADCGGVRIIRCPLYVPGNPNGLKRILHHISFALSATIPMFCQAVKFQPDIVLTVAPSMVAAPVGKLAALICGAKTWLHIQDFEVEAGFATNQLDECSVVGKFAIIFEKFILAHFDKISTISYEMCNKLLKKGKSASDVFELRNWADINAIYPKDVSTFREKWGIETPHVALFSGSITQKQGIEVVVDCARLLKARKDITFVICGAGPSREALERSASDLSNCRFYDLQPYESLNDLLALATVHLLPQKADAADLVLPSKLTNMLASGRPVIAGAAAGTGLAREIENCGISVEPENPRALVEALEHIIENQASYDKMATSARDRAVNFWQKTSIIDVLEKKLTEMLNG